MGFEENDFILRQIKQIAASMGKFLSIASVKDLINYESSSEDILSDEEIECIILISNIREIQEKEKLTDEFISHVTGVEINDLSAMENGLRHPTKLELKSLRLFIDSFD